MRKTVGVMAAAAGIAVLGLASAPATSATLPAADAVYILPCDETEYNGFLYSVDTTTGQATRVGSWVNPDQDVFSCAGPAAYNPANGLGYWISWADSEGFLISVDLTTGINTNIGEFTLAGNDYYTPIAIAIDSDGNAWATSWGSTPDELFSVNLATAELTLVGPTGVTPESNNFGLAWDPVTQLVYGYNVDNYDFYTVNTLTGAFTLFNDNVLSSISPYAMAFDSAGQVWGINQDIISAPLADLDDSEELTVINPYSGGGGDIYSESIIIAPAPIVAALADTGRDDSGIVIAGTAGVLFLVAGALLARRRAPRSSQ